MDKLNVKKLFSHKFLSQFIFNENLLPFFDKEIITLDKELLNFERLFLNLDIEKNLISKNEFLASFAISKAENSTLSLKEAEDINKLIADNKDFDFIRLKLKPSKKLTNKDYEKLEFFNIVKIFKQLNQKPFSASELSLDLIKKIHCELTKGLDIFKDYLPSFDLYKSGKLRDNNKIRVGEYIPADYKDIEKEIKELILWLKNNKKITSIAIFHTALYALHPFNNGNKRVCRVLEHILLRQLGLNAKNLYSASYYYHKEKDRYYKYLLYSLEHKNLNHFVSFALEAIVLSIIDVLRSAIEIKRVEFIDKADVENQIKSILQPLSKRKEIQFKNLFKTAKKNMSKQTFVTYLEKAIRAKLITKRRNGRATYYSLNLSLQEEKIFYKWLEFAKNKLAYIPDEIRLF